MQPAKPRLTFAQIINMNVGFFGIQYSFGLQQSAVNPIYDFLGASPDEIPLLNLAGPVTGLIVQPIIGALSDKTWHPRFGRRKPYFFIGAMLCSLALFLYPFSSALWMAVGLLWILDVGNNTAMEPYRAFIADKLNDDQRPTGFQTQSFFTGLGQTLANVSLFVFPIFFLGKTGAIPNWVFASFFLGAICSVGTIWWSMRTTPEIPPTEDELRLMRSSPLNLFSSFIEIGRAIGSMPKVMWQLGLVYLFQWYALFCYWQNSSKSVALSVWKTTPVENSTLYEEAVGWTGLVNGWYNIVTFLSAFALVWFVKKSSPKIVHFVCLVLAGIGFILFAFIENKYLLFPAITGFGIGWASMMGIPYLMVVPSIPKERYGVYMGIINMMIVIPMTLQTLTFGFVMEHWLQNNSSYAIVFAGVLLLLAAAATLLIKYKPADGEVVLESSGH
ncbi:MAG: MFS transporter [Cyclobacteriaceae bacterium]|jgi:maltose/moltooligosaccharide transporter|nr:MFS transporter [Flammeovirgaceae bacterium]